MAKRRRYLVDADAQRVRRLMMAELRAKAVPVKEIAEILRYDLSHTYRLIRQAEAEAPRHGKRRAS